MMRRLLWLAPSLHILAFLFLSQLSLWIDEASSVWFARRSVAELLYTLCDPHPPGYYILLHFWLTPNDGELWLRLLSLLASLLTLLVVYRWLRQWQGRDVAGLALVLLALQPLQVWYSAEIRMYALTQMLTLLTAWIAWQSWQPDADRRLVPLYWLTASAAIWSDYTAVFSLGILQLLWIASGRPQQWRWLLLQIAVCLPSGLVWLASGQLRALGSSYQPVLIATRAANFGISLTLDQAGLLFQAAIILTALAGLVLAWNWGRLTRVGWFGRNLPAALILFWFALLLFSAVPRLFTLKRLLLGLLPWLTIAVAWALAHYSYRHKALTALLTLCALSLMLLTHQKSDWRSLVQQTVPQLAGDSTMIWVDEQAVPAFDYYADDALDWETLFPSQWEQLNRPDASEHLMIVTDDNPYRDLLALLPNSFNAAYRPSDVIDEDGLRLLYFEERGRPGSTIPVETSVTPWDAYFPSPLATCR